MKIERKNLPWSVVELIIEEWKEKVAKYRRQAIDYIRINANIKGFRKWAHIPDEVILKNYSEEYIWELTVSSALDSIYQEALKKEKLFPVAQWEVQEVISQDPLKIRIHIEIFPNIEIDKKYKKIKVKKHTVEVADAEVDRALTDIQTRFTGFVEATWDYTVQDGDRVTIDTQGFDAKGTPLESTNMKDYPLVIGSKMLVPWFEEGLIGKKKDEEVELKITFPKDYHNADFANKKTTFKVTVKKIEQAKKPEFTPEFIKDLRGKDLDLAGFKKLVKEEILETKESNARLEDENALIDELKKVTTVDFWKRMLENQIQNVFEEIKQNLQQQNGVKMSDYLASLNLSEEQYKESNVKPIAEKRLFGELTFHKLLELEPQEVTDEDVKNEALKVLGRFENPDVVKRLEELYKPGERYFEELKQRMKYKKLIDSFFE